jgi:hypothetical protein
MVHFQLPKQTVQRWIPLMMVGMIVAFVALAYAPRSADAAGPDTWKRCEDIYGSPLCITVAGKVNERARITVSYEKNAGPERDVRLYFQRCKGSKRVLVAHGHVDTEDGSAPRHTISGTRTRKIQPNSCWIGIMRVVNMRFVTGELRIN